MSPAPVPADIAIATSDACALCGGGLEEVIGLPAFPLTGIFVEPGRPFGPQQFDQALMVCRGCGHAQLRHRLPPALLYGNGYAHRSSASHLSSAASDFFVAYVERLLAGRTPRCVLEVGCNDLVLLRKMAPRAVRVQGVDPLWREAPPPADLPGNARLLGRFIEEVEPDDLGEAPDLIISTHNLEHLGEPAEQYRRLMAMAADDALFVIEVPDSTLMVRHHRFDQVFHQHYHYFTLASMLRFVEAVGGRYVDHTWNHRNWGGSLSVAFAKSGTGAAVPAARPFEAAALGRHYQHFRAQMAAFRATLDEAAADGPMWGYGAGQMVPAVAYHLESDLSFLRGILDDNPARAGLVYPLLPAVIGQPSADLGLADATVAVLALDGVRPIVGRLREFNPRYILTPSCVF